MDRMAKEYVSNCCTKCRVLLTGFLVLVVVAAPIGSALVQTAAAEPAFDNGYMDFLYGSIRPDSPRSGSGPRKRETADRSTRRHVAYKTDEASGTILIDTSARRLYLIEGGGFAYSYQVGVGREGYGWYGTENITSKRDWPDWYPPADMLARRPDLPRYMAGGPDNPLGARALYLGSTLYRIHGSNEPETIGMAASSGCFRMTNTDVIDLYKRVNLGAKVRVF